MNVARTTDLEIVMRVAALAETVTVTAASPLVSVTSSTLGQVVETTRIESLPLNGRQFANLAATVPGVGLGFHSDLLRARSTARRSAAATAATSATWSTAATTTTTPSAALLQLFPLEAIQEFNVMTQRFDAEHGRGGAVLNVVTKSGTNDLRGSWFTLFRDDGLNAQTFTRADQRHPQAGLQALPVRRQPRRPDRRGQGALFRRLRAHAAGHEAGREHARPVSV